MKERMKHSAVGALIAGLAAFFFCAGISARQTPIQHFTPSAKTPETDWPLARHDAANTGFIDQDLAPPLRLLRRISTRADKPIILASGDVFCVADDDEALLYNMEGQLVWRLPKAAPMYLKANRLIVVQDRDAGTTLRCYDWRSKRLLWERDIARQMNRFFSSLTESNGVLYLAYLSPGTLMSLRLSDGHSLANRKVDGWNVGPPALCDGRLYSSDGHWLTEYDPATLKPHAKYYNGGNTYPLCVDHSLVTQGFDYMVQGIDLRAPRQAWVDFIKGKGGVRDSAHAGAWGGYVMRGGYHCLVRGRGDAFFVVEGQTNHFFVAALKPDTGQAMWRISVGTPQEGLAAGAGHYVYFPGWHTADFGRSKGKGKRIYGIYCADGRTGRVVWSYVDSGIDRGTTLAISGGKLFALSPFKGSLYIFGRK